MNYRFCIQNEDKANMKRLLYSNLKCNINVKGNSGADSNEQYNEALFITIQQRSNIFENVDIGTYAYSYNNRFQLYDNEELLYIHRIVYCPQKITH